MQGSVTGVLKYTLAQEMALTLLNDVDEDIARLILKYVDDLAIPIRQWDKYVPILNALHRIMRAIGMRMGIEIDKTAVMLLDPSPPIAWNFGTHIHPPEVTRYKYLGLEIKPNIRAIMRDIL